MKRATIAIGLALLIGTSGASGQQHATCVGPQIGTWALNSFTTEDLETGQKTNLFGDHPNGYLSYSPDCRMYAILIRDNRKTPATLVPTDAEKIDLYSGLVAYAGRYTINGDKVSHHIDASWNQAWTGTTQVREFKVDGKTLHIRTLPARNSLTGKQSSSVLIWTKVE